jgi:hypothetical protein
MPQSTNHILLVRPANFGANAQTKATNSFQQELYALSPAEINQKAQAEFDHFANTLQQAGITVHVFEDRPDPIKPDAVFPNNWISMHHNGLVLLFPMHTPNRMAERRTDIIEALKKAFAISEVLDLYQAHQKDWVLEGTGSMVLDHLAKKAYACASPRTHPTLFYQVCSLLQYSPVFFNAHTADGTPIYHTNVMMCIGDGFAVVCLESITDAAQKENLVQQLTGSGHEIVAISLAQMVGFAGNMLQVLDRTGNKVLVLSQTAHDSLTDAQRTQLAAHAQLLPIAIPTIETIGGGSARCMMAEIFLPQHTHP